MTKLCSEITTNANKITTDFNIKASTDLHLHLYGCLTANDLWELATHNKHWRTCTKRLDWYEREFDKAWGRRPNSSLYWNNEDDGISALRNDYLFLDQASFSKFQACFNLIIALLKITPTDHSVLELVAQRHKHMGMRYCEYRVVFPSWLSDADLNRFLTTQTSTLQRINADSPDSFEAKLVYSFDRQNDLCWLQYTALKTWMKINRPLASAICGIDFSSFETGHPPSKKANFFATVIKDNLQDPELALAILYHVGESFEESSIESAARWVYQAHDLGCHRLGHAIALGITPGTWVKNKYKITESKEDRLDHLIWVRQNYVWLWECGFDAEFGEECEADEEAKKSDYELGSTDSKNSIETGLKNLALEISSIRQKPISWRFQPTYASLHQVKNCLAFQQALMKKMGDDNKRHHKNKRSIIEVCPTSNTRIGMIKCIKNHPLRQFIANDLSVCISTDDPGIFDISLMGEFEICRSKIGIPTKNLIDIDTKTSDFRSELLSGRSEKD